jgi:UDP-N-acetylglucosamine diphosphorylase/glucosamine-1-phosphate N-acetyltransferase
MQLVLFEAPGATLKFLPLTYTRPIAHLQLGIFTLVEKWEYLWKQKPILWLEDYRAPLFSEFRAVAEPILFVNSQLTPNQVWVDWLFSMPYSEGALFTESGTLVFCLTQNASDIYTWPDLCRLAADLPPIDCPIPIRLLQTLPQLFLWNGNAISEDFALLRQIASPGMPLTDPYTKTYKPENIYLGADSEIWAAILNATKGPIYIGEKVVVQEGSVLQGPLAIRNNAVISPGAILRPETTIGPYCKIGGEVSNANIHAYSNKSHHGFLGNAVIGSWCNLGAGTSCSNLKNNYGKVKIFDYSSRSFCATELQFCGVLMGDHSKTSINTMLNTGTVVGVFANIWGGGFPPKWIPSFSWGGAAGLEVFLQEQALAVATRVMQRRNLTPDAAYRSFLEELWRQTQWERETGLQPLEKGD